MWWTAIPPVSVVAILCKVVTTADRSDRGHARRIRAYGKFQLRQRLLAKGTHSQWSSRRLECQAAATPLASAHKNPSFVVAPRHLMTHATVPGGYTQQRPVFILKICKCYVADALLQIVLGPQPLEVWAQGHRCYPRHSLHTPRRDPEEHLDATLPEYIHW